MKVVETQETDPAGVYASWLQETQYKEVPADIVGLHKGLLLDTLGVMLAGAYQAGASQAYDYVKNWGGKPEARIIAHGDRVPLPNAAVVNAGMARALDFADHGMELIVPVLISTADLAGNINGKELITALVLSSEIRSRISRASKATAKIIPEYRLPAGYHWGPICAAARLLNLTIDQTWSAIGLGFHCVTDTSTQGLLEGTLASRAWNMFQANNAVSSVLWAKAGVTGTRNVFLGKRGYLAFSYPNGNEPALLTRGLGTEWMPEFNQKTYSIGSMAQSAIQIARDIVKENKVALEDIALMEFGSAFEPMTAHTSGKWDPKTMTEGQFSLPYGVATGLVKGKVFVDDYAPEEMQRPDVQALLEKIKVSLSDDLVSNPDFRWGAKLKMTLKNGAVYRKEMMYQPGHQKNPLTWDAIVNKFHVCASYVKLPQENQDRIISMISDIEGLKDATELVDLLIIDRG